MPYFPQKEKTAYLCPGCERWFYPGNPGNTMCLVRHAPGTCCHQHETPAPTPASREKVEAKAMSELGQTKIAFLFEHEIRLAAKALRRYHEIHADDAVSDEDKLAALDDAMNASSAALWHAADDSMPLMMARAEDLFGRRGGR